MTFQCNLETLPSWEKRGHLLGGCCWTTKREQTTKQQTIFKFETLNSIAKKSLCNKVFISRVKAMEAKARVWTSCLKIENSMSFTTQITNSIFEKLNKTQLELDESQIRLDATACSSTRNYCWKRRLKMTLFSTNLQHSTIVDTTEKFFHLKPFSKYCCVVLCYFVLELSIPMQMIDSVHFFFVRKIHFIQLLSHKNKY